MQVNDQDVSRWHNGWMVDRLAKPCDVDGNTCAHFAQGIASQNCSAAMVALLHEIGREMPVGAGRIARVETTIDHFAFLDSGAAKLVAYASFDREQVVAFHFRGDLVWLPARATHVYELCALAPTTLSIAPAGAFLAIAGQDAALMGELFDRILLALHRCREKSISLGRKSAPERIAGFLTTMFDRIGTGSPTAREMILPMSRRDIAGSLGLTIETVSRQFTELRQAGLIETRGRSLVRVRDRAGLEARAGYGPHDAQ